MRFIPSRLSCIYLSLISSTERSHRKKKKSSPDYAPKSKKRRVDDDDGYYDENIVGHDDDEDEIRKIRRKTEYMSPTSDNERELKKKSKSF